MINAREGMRRLGLLLGVIGAIIGCVYSFAFIGESLNKRDEASRFQTLARTYWNLAPLIPVGHPPSGYVLEYPNGGSTTVKSDMLRQNGIESVGLQNGYLAFIDTTDGSTLFGAAPPATSDYVFDLTFPLLGFFLPRGIVAILVWVGGGFFQRVPPVAIPPQD